MKRVVFLGHYNGGKKDFDARHFFFAKELVELGYEATIINAAFSHRIRDAMVISEPYSSHIEDGVKFLSVKTPKYFGNGFGRIINMFAFVINIIRHTNSISAELGKVDVIVMASPHPFQFFAAKILSKKLKAKLIIEIKDIWPLSIIEIMNTSKFHPFVILLSITERLMHKYSDLTISPLDNLNEYFKDYNIQANSVFVPTGLNLSFYDNINSDKLSIKLPDNKFIIGYIGGLTESNAIDFLLETASFFDSNYKDIVILIVGDGAQREKLTSAYKNENIIFTGALSKDDAFRVMQRCDVLYRASPGLNLDKYGISPLKINEYMYSKTPIVHVFDLEEQDMVKMAKCGISIKFGSKEELINAILKIYSMPKEEREKMGQNGKEYVKNNLSYKVLVKKMIEVL